MSTGDVDHTSMYCLQYFKSTSVNAQFSGQRFTYIALRRYHILQRRRILALDPICSNVNSLLSAIRAMWTAGPN